MNRESSRRAFLASVGVGTAALAGCLGGRNGTGDASGASTSSEETTAAGGTQTGPPSRPDALPLPWPAGDVAGRAVSGGPPKDGIPSIDDPSFESADDADDHLDPGDPVFGLAVDGDVRAYPQSILVAHEICNDVVAGRPVSVTYCPLTGTAMGFERGETTFGVSGRLVNNNLVMYDRATETWWPQVLATGVPGPWNSPEETRSLREFRLVWTTWGRWRDQHPDTEVLSRDTGFAKNYDRDPYGSYNPRRGYYEPESAPMFSSPADDDRLATKTVVLGARTPEGAVAFEKHRLRNEHLVTGDLAGTPVLAVYDDALDTGYVYRNPEDRAFEFRDDGTVESADGETHDPTSLPLDRVLAFDAMWFAWNGFYPDTSLYA
ncbi:DUF3179 domain-containing protein [Halobacterium rubrum]|uniref:DUF3179 domain-containing protein n=1 Tax=Halobacterium TaxID=2239 RepID=UPI001F469ADB|nr:MULTISPECIES: DUF3179 domain-containing (seleno)protein [Halobacterium]MDH5020327.1 DUF3179 domain-containing (seleno)protein [Halobacterium rubrum]